MTNPRVVHRIRTQPQSPRPFRSFLSSIAAAFALVLSLWATTEAPAIASNAPVDLFSDLLEPEVRASSSTEPINLGLKFSSERNGHLASLQFYRSAEQKRSYQAFVWDTDGQLLATTTFAASSVPGWQTAELPSALRVWKGRVYTVSYHATDGRFAYTDGVFTNEVRNNQLRGLKRGGFHAQGDEPVRPTRAAGGTSYMLDVLVLPDGGPTSPGELSTPSPRPGTPEPSTAPSPTPTPSAPGGGNTGGGWPNAGNTGVPAGVSLTRYTGPMTITTPNTVIRNATVNGTLRIQAPGVQIINTRINGTVMLSSPRTTNHSFSITDSEVHIGNQMNNLATGLSRGNFSANRVEITGGRRGASCEYNCTIENSWVHGQSSDPGGKAHFSGIRMGEKTTLRHNNITCEAQRGPGTGCSAPLTGYGDFGPVQHNLIENNIFRGGTSGTCAYGGSSGADGSKPHGHLANNIRFINNVFIKGPSGKCGTWSATMNFDPTRPGNVFTGNTWDDGTPLTHND